MCLAIPGKVVQLTTADPLERTAKVEFGGILRDVSIACTPEVKLGDFVLVHAGFALAVVDAQEAERVLASLRDLDAEEFMPEVQS